MTKITLMNPYIDKTIKVKESVEYIKQCINNVNRINEEFIVLTQINPNTEEEKLITINPKNWAKVEVIAID